MKFVNDRQRKAVMARLNKFSIGSSIEKGADWLGFDVPGTKSMLKEELITKPADYLGSFIPKRKGPSENVNQTETMITPGENYKQFAPDSGNVEGYTGASINLDPTTKEVSSVTTSYGDTEIPGETIILSGSNYNPTISEHQDYINPNMLQYGPQILPEAERLWLDRPVYSESPKKSFRWSDYTEDEKKKLKEDYNKKLDAEARELDFLEKRYKKLGMPSLDSLKE